MRHSSKVTTEKLWPEELCPVCGKQWTRMCRKREWGYAYTPRGSRNGYTVLLCSGPCLREYARRDQKKSAEHVATLRCFRAWWMYDQEWLDRDEIARRLNTKRDDVKNMIELVENMYWQEADYIVENGIMAAG